MRIGIFEIIVIVHYKKKTPIEAYVVNCLKKIKKDETLSSKWKLLAVKEVKEKFEMGVQESKYLVEKTNHDYKIFEDKYFENLISGGRE